MVMVLIILSINIVYVSFFTIRMILTLKGQKYLAASLSSIEVLIYVIGLGLVLDNLNEIQNLIAYAVGYAIGVLVGTKIEEMLALGYVTVKVITNRFDQPFSQFLRDQGYGVTTWMGEGRDGKRLMMEILTRRKAQEELYNLIVAYDPKAFIISHEPRHFHGGFWVKGLKKHAQEQGEEYTIVNEENLPGVTEESVQEVLEQSEELSELVDQNPAENQNQKQDIKINYNDKPKSEKD
ncbi:uncharacterized protein YebE (UPF0316 family) [Bacillus horti]|uniref:UPF0316 protein J2S11_004515 n=1 Tax=Caldalkalibacillus horti TaxID=77523 RepID=A0ABT9W5N0_9BACI|nr:DUF2179 domain-containing protein [Bacillus horti]MDQ0168553.1 uncharacterized protein YebE (UPF0316 family) [Bacillus horti]